MLVEKFGQFLNIILKITFSFLVFLVFLPICNNIVTLCFISNWISTCLV